MRYLVIAIVAIFTVSATPVLAGSCDHSYQTAKDGSSCGGRAADQRSGGR
jgi:hypothetical protein